jgi:hypothetical protein
MSALYFGLLILFLLVLVYFISYYWNNGELPSAPFEESMNRMKNSVSRSWDSYFTSAESMYEKTIGYINDDAAKMALEKAKQKEKMYERNEKLGRLSDKNIADAASTSFMIADLYRFNVAPNEGNPNAVAAAEDTAATQYAIALHRIAMNPLGVVQAAGTHMPAPEFVIDRVEDFYDDYIARATMEAREPNEHLANVVPNLQQLRNDVRNARVVAAGNAAAAGNVPRRLPQGARRKRRNAEPASQREIMRDNYFAENDIRNDPQNVHESQVNKDMARIYQSILHRNQVEDDLLGNGSIKDGAEIAQNITALRDYARSHKFENPKGKERAMKTIDVMSKGNWITSLNARESEILSNVWKRTGSAENEQNRVSLRGSLMNSLADCIEDGYNNAEYQVCISGRVGRVLGSMTLLDADERISEPIKTAEILRNEIFSKSYKIIQDALKETDDETARGYNGALDSPAPEVETKVRVFEDQLRERIENTLRTEYEDKVDKKVLENLIQDAKAGV